MATSLRTPDVRGYPSATHKTLQVVRNPLLIGHHVLSVLIWPYAMLQQRGLLPVLFYIVTEITNVSTFPIPERPHVQQ